VIAEISSSAFASFFAWSPWVIGAIIYGAFWFAKRNESSSSKTSAAKTTYACAVCGRRGPLEQMVPQQHGGAVGYQCTQCASQAVAH
jgi:DNA-directed RNA polymerase subunit RPC12/RpoP